VALPIAPRPITSTSGRRVESLVMLLERRSEDGVIFAAGCLPRPRHERQEPTARLACTVSLQSRSGGHYDVRLALKQNQRWHLFGYSIPIMTLSALLGSQCLTESIQVIPITEAFASPDQHMTIPPILKWAGGKRWLVQSHPDIFPVNFERYVEPFAGSAAVFFHLRPDQAILADTNRDLIDCYAAIRADHVKVAKLLQRHQKLHSNAHYYRVRATAPRDPFMRAARLIYLNRTCFNGLYRVNQQGQFNVPRGNKDSVVLATDNYQSWAESLRNAKLVVSDFEPIIDATGERDFVFVDPPYTVTHNLNGFVKYNEVLFSWEDQVRLADCLLRAQARGVAILATNADHPAIRRLYRCNFRVRSVERHSLIAGATRHRGSVREVLISSKSLHSR
jgi:DNA adenine methylase